MGSEKIVLNIPKLYFIKKFRPLTFKLHNYNSMALFAYILVNK